jgi:hypothetical protein
MSAVERFCDHGVVLERGRLVDDGEPKRITRTYNELNFGQISGGEADAAAASAARFIRGWCESESGEQLVTSRQGEDIHACFEVEFTRAIEDPVLSIALRNEVRHTILVATADEGPGSGGRYSEGDRAIARFAFKNMLAPSRYTFTARVLVRDRGIYGEAEDLFALVVQAESMSGGIVDLPYEAEVRRL